MGQRSSLYRRIARIASGTCILMTSNPKSAHSNTDTNYTCDVLVVGSGAAGMATALRAAHDGLNVIVAEESSYFGGTIALSAGWSWVPGNRNGSGATGDNRAEAEEYLKAPSPESLQRRRRRWFLRHCAGSDRFFRAAHESGFHLPGEGSGLQDGFTGREARWPRHFAFGRRHPHAR